MEIKASLNYLRISPRKVRLVVDLIKGMPVERAQTQLRFLVKKASLPVLKLLNSALANAEHNFKLQKTNLYIKNIQVNQGPPLKRWMPRAFGRATPILKRTSHVMIVLGEGKAIQEIAKKDKMEVAEEIRNVVANKPEKIKEAKTKLKAARELGKKRFGTIRKIFQRKAI